MRTKKLLAVLLSATVLATACKDDQIGPGTTGTIRLRIVATAAAPDLSSQRMPEFPRVSKARAEELAGDVISLVVEGSGTVDSAEAASMASDSAALLRREAYMPPGIDQLDVDLVGAQTVSGSFTFDAPNNQWTYDSPDLTEGSYTLTLTARETGLVTYYGETNNVQVIANQNTTVNANFNVFVPVLNAFVSPTTFTSFAAAFSTVADATSYTIEFDTDPAFSTLGSITSTTSPAGLFTTAPGTFYFRVRAANGPINDQSAMPSNVEAITIIPDTTSGSDQSSALPVTPGILDSLNILPSTDEDWFELNLSIGDGLSAWVYARVLTPTSRLDADLELRDAAGNSLGYNDDDGNTLDSWLDNIAIPADGLYYLIVGSSDINPTAGYYELDIQIVPGGGVGSITVTPTLDTLQGASATTQLTATAFDALGNTLSGVPLTWSSSDSSVAVPDANGLVTAGVDGTAIITVSTGNASATATIVVATPPVDFIQMAPYGVTLVGGTFATVTADPQDINGATVPGVNIQWRSLNPAVVTVDQAGVATAAGPGQTAVEALAGGVTGYSVITVNAPRSPVVNFVGDENSPTTQLIHGIWGMTGTDVHVASQIGVIHYDGTSWTIDNSVSVPPLLDVWGAEQDEVFLVGEMGTIVYYDGATYSLQSTPTVEHLNGVWGAAPDEVFAAGLNGIVLFYDGAAWSIDLNLGGGINFQAVWGSSGDDVFVVGDGGAIYHYDHANGWAQMTSNTTANLRGVWGLAPNDVWAVGEGGTTMHYNGLSWSAMTVSGSTANYNDVWGTGSTDIYIVGNGSSWKWDGTSWTFLTNHFYRAFYGTANESVFGVTSGGRILRGYRGASYQASASVGTLTAVGDTVTLTVVAADSNGVPIPNPPAPFFTSANPSIATVDSLTGLITAVANGSVDIQATARGISDLFTMTVAQVATSVSISPDGASIAVGGGAAPLTVVAIDANGNPIPAPSATWSTSNPNIATVAADGSVTAAGAGQATIEVVVDGRNGYALATATDPTLAAVTIWSSDASGTTENLYGVWGDASNSVNAHGLNGSFTQFDGTTWNLGVAHGGWAREGWGLSTNVYYAAVGGQVLFWDGSTWSVATSGPSAFADVWGASPADIFAVGSNGLIKHWDGVSWSTMTSGTNQFLSDVWGTSAANVFAVGNIGTILHYDGTSWSSMTSPNPQSLYGLWGTAPNDIYASGESGTLLHYDGNLWTTMTVPNQRWYSVWGSSGSDIYAAGGAGGAPNLMQYNGTTWTGRVSPTPNLVLFDIWGTAGSEVYAVGANGTIYRGNRGATVSLNTTADTIFSLNDSTQLVATALDENGGAITGATTFFWSSSDSSVAVPNATGWVVGNGFGTATITARAPGGALTTATVEVMGMGQITVGGYHACGIMNGGPQSAGPAYCWGLNEDGQVGDATGGQGVDRNRPTAVAGGLSFIDISASDHHTCALDTNGVAYCWGDGSYGEIGDGANTDRNVPTAVSGGLTYTDITVGAGGMANGIHTCAIATGGAAYCWGGDEWGALGNDTSGANLRFNTPQPVSGGKTWLQIEAGDLHTCAIDTGNLQWCWGYNVNAQLGNDTANIIEVPVQVSSPNPRVATGGGNFISSCGLSTGFSAYCWGANFSGNLGTGDSTLSPIPVAVAGGLQYNKISVGGTNNTTIQHVCGVTAAGQIYCWGDGSQGQLGDGLSTGHPVPTAVTGGNQYFDVDVGAFQACGIDIFGRAWCWGSNTFGQLGTGNMTQSNVPVRVIDP